MMTQTQKELLAFIEAEFNKEGGDQLTIPDVIYGALRYSDRRPRFGSNRKPTNGDFLFSMRNWSKRV